MMLVNSVSYAGIIDKGFPYARHLCSNTKNTLAYLRKKHKVNDFIIFLISVLLVVSSQKTVFFQLSTC